MQNQAEPNKYKCHISILIQQKLKVKHVPVPESRLKVQASE